MTTTLLCLPYAGGSKLSFKGMANRNKNLKIKPLEYLGHGEKFNDIAESLEQIIEDCYKEIIDSHIKNYYILGYSMGAIIGYELIKKLEKNNKEVPLGLFVLSSNSPNIKLNGKFTDINSNNFLSNIKKLGGIPAVLLENKVMLDFFFSIMKNDFRMLNDFLSNVDFEPINTNITVFFGNKDQVVDESSVGNWANFTTKSCILQKLDDGHFINQTSEIEMFNYINEHCFNQS